MKADVLLVTNTRAHWLAILPRLENKGGPGATCDAWGHPQICQNKPCRGCRQKRREPTQTLATATT